MEEKENIKKISKYVESSSERVTLETISQDTGIDPDDIDDIYKNALLLTYVMNRIIINCKICNEPNIASDMNIYVCKACRAEAEGKEYISVKPSDPTKIKIELRSFDKNIMHTKKAHSQDTGSRYGLRSKRDR